ncbi:MAG: DUF3108 domain-containing protein [Rhodospirillaceae bacterium]
MLLHRPFIAALAGMLLPFAAARADAPVERAVLSYDIHLGGLNVAQADLTVTLGSQGYQVESEVASTGLAGRMMAFSTTSHSIGTWQPDGPQPTLHRSTSVWRGSQRAVELVYDNGDTPRTVVSPPPSSEDREPVPEAARAGTIDPMSGALALMRSVLGEAAPAPIFDGRRMYTLALGEVMPAQVESPAYSGDGWRGVVQYERKFGRAAGRSMFRRDTGIGEASIHIAPGAKFGVSLPVPVRIEVATQSVGSLVVALTGVRVLPADQEALRPCTSC